MQFNQLVNSIQHLHQQLQQQVALAVNVGLTVRNWLVGYYIVEYEQKGAERAKYGDKLLKELAKALKIKGFSATSLYLFRQFYMYYPKIYQTLSDEFKKGAISPTLSGKFNTLQKHQTPSDELRTMALNSIYEALTQKPETDNQLLLKLSFSHFTQLIKINDPLKRQFYEIECIKGIWSVRELRRQVSSLYYERSAMSKDKAALSDLANQQAAISKPTDVLKDFYVFEFLDLPNKHTVSESDLETALLDNIQQLILELGTGFCFEARQKRILIGKDYFFIDLVFYHRILKCHFLIDLKVDKFEHHYVGQLNTYINYYNDESTQIKQPDDKPAIGLLLVTNQNQTYVKYATAGLEDSIFVKQYMIQLPSEDEIREALERYLNDKN